MLIRTQQISSAVLGIIALSSYPLQVEYRNAFDFRIKTKYQRLHRNIVFAQSTEFRLHIFLNRIFREIQQREFTLELIQQPSLAPRGLHRSINGGCAW